MQAVEVRVEAHDPNWGGALDCQASNALGSWLFVAPGTIDVAVSTSPLEIVCTLSADAVGASGAMTIGASVAPQDWLGKGMGAGATVGAVAGVALAVGAVPLMGPTFAALLIERSTLSGAQIGGMLGGVSAGDLPAYPTPIVVRIKAPSLPD